MHEGFGGFIETWGGTRLEQSPDGISEGNRD
jgi:hypothetical protein